MIHANYCEEDHTTSHLHDHHDYAAVLDSLTEPTEPLTSEPNSLNRTVHSSHHTFELGHIRDDDEVEETTEVQKSNEGVTLTAAVIGMKRPASRPVNVCWAYFTNEPTPWFNKSAVCKHCQKEVSYWRKAQTVLVHLKSCTPFRESMNALENDHSNGITRRDEHGNLPDIVGGSMHQGVIPDFCLEWMYQEVRQRRKQSDALRQQQYATAYGYLQQTKKLIPDRICLVNKLLDEYGVEGATDLRFLDDGRRHELGKCLKFVPERKFLELLQLADQNHTATNNAAHL